MMQMLAAAGVGVLSDGVRPPNEDNPRGYFELEAVKSIATDARWLEAARGKAVKIVTPLLQHLPRGLPCRVIWMKRPLDEVLSSQALMLERAGAAAEQDEALLRRAFAGQSQRMRAELEARDLPTLVVAFGELIANPQRIASAVCRFLGDGLDAAAAAEAVDPLLYRHRSLSAPSGADDSLA